MTETAEWDNLRNKIIGLGEHSVQKSYYPELQRRLADLERFRALLDQSNDAIFLAQIPAGTIVDVNQAACRQTGYSREELLALTLKDLVPAKICAGLESELAGETTWVANTPITSMLFTHDGDTLPVEINIQPVILNDTKYAVAVARDITERQKAEEIRERLEEQLRQAQKLQAIGTLAGGVAHDFNNMLTALMGYADLAQRALPGDDPVQNELKGIQRIAERAAQLTRQLLTFARQQGGTPRIVQVNQLLLDLDKMLRRLIGADIELITILDPAAWLILADPHQIEQVVINLVVNARDAMPQGGQLKIETANITLTGEDTLPEPDLTPGPYLCLTVSDTGHGMPDEVKSRIFEPFFTTKEVGQGTGLGLAMVFGIVRQSEGHISFSSQVGEGTIFSIYFPRVKDTAAPVSPQSQIAIGKLSGTETVLLVEDQPDIRELIARTLREQGYTVLEAANGEDALQLLKDNPAATVELLVTDMVMPRLGGKELAHRLRTVFPHLKVLMISGYTAGMPAQTETEAQTTVFLPKPFLPELLAQKVRQLLDGPPEG